MPKLSSIITEFGSYYQNNMLLELPDNEAERKDQLRVSGFPYCGLKKLYLKLNKVNEGPKKRGFGMQFYTGVGTITHEVIQEFLGQGGRMYGVWNCVARGCRGKREFSKNSRCPLCGSTMLYEEFTVTAFKNLSGHLDGIYKSKSGHWFVVDYKTSSSKTIQTQKFNKTLPYKYNVAQIRAYCSLIELFWDIKISGWLLHYLARDSPATIHYTCGGLVTTRSKRLEMEKMEIWDQHFEIIKSIKSFKQIERIIEEKPCKTFAQYEEEYHSFTACPLSNGGVCFNPKRLTETMQLSWEDYKDKTKYKLLPTKN